MAMVRTTLILDEMLVQLVRQRFGSISSGINEVLKEHLIEEQKSESLFGAGRKYKLLKKFVGEEEEDERRLREHDKTMR